MSIKKINEYDQKKNTITHCRPTHGTLRKSYRTSGRQTSKATSSLFPIKMIAKLERTHSNVQQNKEQAQNPTMGATINNESIQRNRLLRTTNPFLDICMEKQYSENVSIDAFDNNTRLKN